jgi:hypothetical protein
MARLYITDAAKVTGVSRVTLFRHIKAGKLTRHPDGTIDTAELQRAGFTLQPIDGVPGVAPPPAPPVAPTPRQSAWQRLRAFLGGRTP